MAGPWTISRDRRHDNGDAHLRAAFGRVLARSRRVLPRRPATRTLVQVPAAAEVPAAAAAKLALTVSADPLPPAPSVTAPAPALSVTAPARDQAVTGPRPPSFPVGARWSRVLPRLPRIRIGRPLSARVRAGLAVPFLALITAVAVVLAWATVQVAERGVAATRQAAMRVGGPLTIPAPRVAGRLPRRFGPINDPAVKSIVAEFRQRFGAVGAGLVADARRAADAAASGTGPQTKQITAAWTSGLYGEPGHLDPSTYRPAWIMYVGMDATGVLGRPADSVARLMTGLLGPYAVVGPWPVTAGHRGGSVNCTVAWLGQTSASVCGWATGHTVGALVSPVRDTGVRELAALLTQMRYDLQRA